MGLRSKKFEWFELEFYVYVYLNPLKPGKYRYGPYEFDYEPFYVGKGSGNRKNIHLTKKSLDVSSSKNSILKEILCKKVKPIIIELESLLNEYEANEIEKWLINLIGRMNLKKGPLTNLTNGGEGIAGIIFSSATKENIRLSKMGEKNPNFGKCGEKNSFFGKKHSEETRKKIKIARARQTFTEEYRKKMSVSVSGNKHWNWGKKTSEKTKEKIKNSLNGRKCSFEQRTKIIRRKNPLLLVSPDGIFYENVYNLALFCDEHRLNIYKFKNALFLKRRRTSNNWWIEEIKI